MNQNKVLSHRAAMIAQGFASLSTKTRKLMYEVKRFHGEVGLEEDVFSNMERIFEKLEKHCEICDVLHGCYATIADTYMVLAQDTEEK